MDNGELLQKIEKIVEGQTADPTGVESSLAAVKLCLEDLEPKRGSMMLLVFAAGVAKGVGLTVGEIDDAVWSGYHQAKKDPA
jgi:hypothetical protein